MTTGPVTYDAELTRYSAVLRRAWAVRPDDRVLDIGDRDTVDRLGLDRLDGRRRPGGDHHDHDGGPAHDDDDGWRGGRGGARIAGNRQ